MSAPQSAPTAADVLAQRFHETYERLAPEFGYETREASAVPWADVPEANKSLMVAVCAELLGTEGTLTGIETVECHCCNGTGIEVNDDELLGPCEDCNGTGVLWRQKARPRTIQATA